MTDKDIIKALECCQSETTENCGECPLKFRGDCTIAMVENTLALINRQQAEIESITEKFNCQQTVYADLSKIIKEKNTEIERLNKENTILSQNADTAFQDGLNEAQDLYAEQIRSEIKSEAIKEFSERLCQDRVSNDPVVIAVKVELKELEGEDK